MPLPIWKDFAKVETDFLTDDFTTDNTVKVKTTTAEQGMTFTVEDAIEKEKIGGKVGLKWKHKPTGFSLDKLQFKPKKCVLETSLPVAGWKTTLKGDLYKPEAFEVGAEKTDAMYSATAAADQNSLTLGGVAGLSGLAFGAGLSYGFKAGAIALSGIGASYTMGPIYASLTTKAGFKDFDISAMYTGVPKLTACCNVKTNFDSKNDVTLVGQYACSPSMTVKGALTKFEKLEGAATKKVFKGFTFTGSCETTLSDISALKYGYLLTLG